MRLLGLAAVLLLLLLGLLPSSSAVPRQLPTRRDHPELQDVRTVTLVAPSVVTATDCPGAVGRNCTRQCQLRICKALVDFYRVANNASDPWDEEEGWVDSETQSCEQLLSRPGPQGLPAYCRWHGVQCCDAAHAADEQCYLLGSVRGVNQAMNNVNVSLSDPTLLRSLKTLHACGLTIFDVESNNVAGSLTEEWGQLRHLQYLNIGTCWVSGTIPNSLRNMHNLTFLNIGNNWFSGTLPNWLPDLHHLRVLNCGSQFGDNPGTTDLGLRGTIPARIGEMENLRELVLQSNSLTGRLPQNLCRKGKSSLLVLNVRGNRLEGSAEEVESCFKLVQLDLSSNQFSGRLPATSHWEQLATYTLGHNQFSGSWALALSQVRILEYLDISHNHLTGVLPPQITLLTSLKSLKLANNMFSGTITEDLYYLPALSVVELSSNQFVGTTPVSIGLSYSLSELDLSNNTGITGEIPSQLALLPRLQTVKLMQTNKSCAGIIKPYTVTTNNSCNDPKRCHYPQQFGDLSAGIKKCAPDALLPCFLKFTDFYIPRDDDSNMRCKQIVRKPTEEARTDCAGPERLADQASAIPDKRWMARWEIDPSYYQYQACECLMGFSGMWDDSGTILTCVEEKKGAQHKGIIIACAVAGVAVLAAALLLWRQYLRTRPRWLRERLLQAKRSKGPPKAAKPGDRVLVSIVVTDVKDFSELTRRYPELMNKAMGGHNNMMRKACHAHAGHVMDQEGDSWTIAFHDAEDAVAFALQVQQALADRAWGIKLPNSPSSNATAQAHIGSLTSQASDHSAGSSYGFMGSLAATATPPLPPGSARDLAANAAGNARANGSFSAASDDRGSSVGKSSSLPGSRGCSFTFAGAAQGAEVVSQADIEAGLARCKPPQPQPSPVALCIDDTRLSRDGSMQQQSPHSNALSKLSGSETSPFAGQPGFSHTSSLQASGSMASSRPSRLFSAGSALMHRLSQVVRGNIHSGLLQQGLGEAHGVHELRLSVRIGVATGWLPHGRDLESSSVHARAKHHVSDVANGGQVLIDSHTFRLVKHCLSALGTVEEDGYNDRQLQQRLQAQVVARMQRAACGSSCCSRGSKADASFTNEELQPSDYDTDAIVVHMGGFLVTTPSSAAAATTSGESSHSAEDDDSCGGETATALAGKARRAARRAGNVRKEQTVHMQLYSIAAPKMRRLPQHTSDLHLMGWCQAVQQKPGWVQVQKDYFQAPGTRREDLVPSWLHDRTCCQSPLPAITFVFAEVPGAHSLAHRHHKAELHALNKAIKRCMQEVMACLPGGDGYMCRCHEADLRFMVAFESPVKAVEWCLLVQEALMYMDWPESTLSTAGFEEVTDPETGQLLLRGPRLRMGVSDGVPSSVLPDHMGHANYTGGSVNRAARFMDAAAHGGQVVCDIGFAERCFAAWAAADAQHLPGRRSWGSGLDCVSPESIPESAAATDWGDPQVSLAQLMALRSQSETSGHCRPATGPQGLRSRALHELWYQQQQLKQGQKEAYHKQAQQPQQFGLEQQPQGAAAGPYGGATSSSGTGGGWHSSNGSKAGFGGGVGSLPRAGPAASGPSFSRFNPLTMAGSIGGLGTHAEDVDRVREPVTASRLGTFSFKGSGVYEMVQLQHTALLGRRFPEEPPKGKGARLSAASGAVQGLVQVELSIPGRVVRARAALRDRSTGSGQNDSC